MSHENTNLVLKYFVQLHLLEILTKQCINIHSIFYGAMNIFHKIYFFLVQRRNKLQYFSPYSFSLGTDTQNLKQFNTHENIPPGICCSWVSDAVKPFQISAEQFCFSSTATQMHVKHIITRRRTRHKLHSSK